MKNETVIITSENELSENELNILQSWIIDKSDLKKLIYLKTGDTVKKIAIDRVKGEKDKMVNYVDRQQLAIVDTEIVKRQQQQRKRKHERKNRGIFDSLRRFFDSERKKKVKEVKFSELLTLVRVTFPKMTEQLLKAYLYNKEQLPKIEWDNKNQVIRLM